MISSILGIKKRAVLQHLKISVVVVVVLFALFNINIIFILINEIQTDGTKMSYRRR